VTVVVAIPIAVPPAAAIVTVMPTIIAITPAAAIVAIVVAVPAPEAAVIAPAVCPHPGKLAPVMLGLGTEEAVTPDIALELALFAADVAATAVPVACLHGGAQQRDSAQQHHPAQSSAQQIGFPSHMHLPATTATGVEQARCL
jgi:hypothetical protein